MNNPDTDLIFPLRVLPLIADSHDTEWKKLAKLACADGSDALDKLGLVLTMVKLAGCVSCNSDSFRAIRGCSQCAAQTIRRQRAGNGELMQLFLQNRKEVESYLENRSKQNERNNGKIDD